MIDTRQFDDLVRRITASLPASVQTLQKDFERQVRSALQQGLERMDLVTREDFAAQTAILERTRAQLDELAQRVARMEGGPNPTDREGSDIT